MNYSALAGRGKGLNRGWDARLSTTGKPQQPFGCEDLGKENNAADRPYSTPFLYSDGVIPVWALKNR